MKISKGRLFLLFFLLFSTFLLPARSYLPTSLVLGMSNDVWSNGLSRNDDDQDSFALYTKVGNELGWLRLDAHAITNRGWREGWIPGKETSTTDGEFYKGRYDDLEILLGTPLSLYASSSDALDLTLEGGVTILGRLGMEYLQNGLHMVAGIHDVALPYEISSPLVRPVVNLDLSYTHHLLTVGNGELSLRLSASLYHSFSLLGDGALSASLLLTGKSGDNAYLSLAWNRARTYSGYSTMELLGAFMDYPRFSFGFQAGAVQVDYEAFFLSDYGNTRVSVDLMKVKDMGERRENGRKDIPKAYVGYSFTPQVNYVAAGFELPLEGKDAWSLIALDRYTAGTPIPTYDEESSDVFASPRMKLNDAFLTVGVKKYFPVSDLFLVPFVHASTGLAFLRYDELRNMIDSPFYREPYYSYHNVRPCSDIGFGVETKNLNIPHLPVPPFDLFLRGGMVLTVGVTKVTPTGVDLSRTSLLPYLELGVSVDMDV